MLQTAKDIVTAHDVWTQLSTKVMCKIREISQENFLFIMVTFLSYES